MNKETEPSIERGPWQELEAAEDAIKAAIEDYGLAVQAAKEDPSSDVTEVAAASVDETFRKQGEAWEKVKAETERIINEVESEAASEA